MRLFSFVHSILFTLFFGAHLSLAQTPSTNRVGGLIITSKSFVRDFTNETVELEGDVKIVFKDQQLSADKVRLNLRSKTMDATGQVLVMSAKTTMGGDRILLDYETDTGVIFNGYVQSGNVVFEGLVIRKTSPTDYLADEARYTACTTCPEAWSFTGSSIRAELGGYAYIKSSLLRFGGVPVFWMPYLVVPLKSERQSGLLTPSFESTESGGLGFAQSFYWAMSRSQDSTWTLKNYELRGLKGLVNYRYVLSENSRGELDMGYLPDKVFSSSSRLKAFQNGKHEEIINRWFIKYNHLYELPEGYVHRASLNNASDLQYTRDFPEETLLLDGDPAMESRTSLTKNTADRHFMMDASYYKNLLQSNPLAGNDDAVHRWPEIRYALSQRRLDDSDWLFGFDLNYTNFARSTFSYDDMNVAADPLNENNERYLNPGGSDPICSTKNWEQDPDCFKLRDGKYDPQKDLLRTGQRLDFRPTLYHPLSFQYLDILPKLSYRATQYTFPVGEKRQNLRQYVRAEVAARTSFSRVFETEDQGRIKHEIRPELTVTAIPWLEQEAHPFFGDIDSEPFFGQENISDKDLNTGYGIQFDYEDRVNDRRLVTMGVTQRFTEKKILDGKPEYRQFLTWKLAQSYDAFQAEKLADKAQAWSSVLSEIRFYLNQVELYQRVNYFPYQRATNASSRIRLSNQKQDFIELWQVLSFNITPGQTTTPDRDTRTETYTVTVKKDLKILEFIAKATYDANPGPDRSYIGSWGYGAQFKLPGDCWYINLNQYKVTGGDPKFRINFGFVWDGETRPPVPDNLGF
jgi:LPS-assembly protein